MGFAIANEESRYTLNGALMVLKPESITMVATDGHRLARDVEDADVRPRRVVDVEQRLVGREAEAVRPCHVTGRDRRLARLAVAGESVVDERAVRPREPAPLLARRLGPRTGPEGAVGCGAHERGRSTRRRREPPGEAMTEPGCEQFEVFQSVANPDRLALLERWTDPAALDAWLSGAGRTTVLLYPETPGDRSLGIAAPLEAAETPIGQGVVYVFSDGGLRKYG